MKKIKGMIAVVAAATTLVTGSVGLTANAANAYLTITTSSGTLHNTSGATRYGNVNFAVINRATGSQVSSAGSSGNIADSSSRTATKSGYSSTTYRFKTNGTLYVGTSQYSGSLWSGSKDY